MLPLSMRMSFSFSDKFEVYITWYAAAVGLIRVQGKEVVAMQTAMPRITVCFQTFIEAVGVQHGAAVRDVFRASGNALRSDAVPSVPCQARPVRSETLCEIQSRMPSNLLILHVTRLLHGDVT